MRTAIRNSLVSTGILIGLTFPTLAAADVVDDSRFGIGLKGGTLGAGIELDYSFNDYFNARLQANGYNYADEFEEDGVDYTGELDLSSYGLLIDWRPFAGTFRFSGGVYSNGNQISGAAASYGGDILEIGDEEYVGSSSDPLRLDALIEMGSGTAGYLGFGWGNSPGGNWMFAFEAGVLFSGSPVISLDASGTAALASNPSYTIDVGGNSPEALELQANIDQEVATLQEDLSDLNIYPVVSLGFGYRF
ncbi:hypothetical protein DXV75_09355 [Alteromonas aestuariivivens]|uniref:Outer membrane protein beta-barrel domain-containing protein n=1 Tax=Alteromonas aestuariivivens TaxID=1938339 RepID=A0A3D8M6U3_9ALTE|nr:hypothetical protein [Alteromonas aestuariivivens]RDV25496.1 hypothetical protein DXV75_09355 [Alteromonas aestuariivivens]